MAYLALYRAWRPQRFEDVVGQEHITQTLKNALREKRFSHAYLFNGPRGTGKTSTAKILAKAVNCELGVSEEPCNQCKTCKGISNGSILDVVEIDAASNRGVEEIRDLREKVKFAPSEAKYKVYIIDEVHMLTTEAFNALLKTLEEPPAHVIFILATTEPHKLPLTIISRCQRFDFRRITTEKMERRLKHIVDSEGYQSEQAALSLIAKHSEGGMRDALSLLDQVLSFSGENIQLDDVLRVTGRIAQQVFSEIAKAIKNEETTEVLDTTSRFIQEGKDPERLLEDFLYYYRDLLLFKTAPDLDELKDRVLTDQEFTTVANMYSDSEIFKIIEVLNYYLNEIKRTNQTRIILELALIKAAKLYAPSVGQGDSEFSSKAIDELKEKVKNLENQLEQLVQSKTNINVKEKKEPKKTYAQPSRDSSTAMKQLRGLVSGVSEEKFNKIKSLWPNILQMVKNKKITVHAWLIDSEPVAVANGKLVLAFNNVMHRDTTNKPQNSQLINEVIQELAGEELSILNVMQKEWRNVSQEMENTDKETIEMTKDDQEESIVTEAINLFGKNLVEIKE